MTRSSPAEAAYRSDAGHYDQRTAMFQHWREVLVDRLPARPGDTVLDVGCGTGLCLPMLYEKVGPAGTIVGIDESDEMVKLARARVRERDLRNVRLLVAPVAHAAIEATADAAIFCAVHDVMQSTLALANVITHLRPGAPVVAIGGKWPAPWLWPLRRWVADLHAPFISDFSGFDRPWARLATFIPDLTVEYLAAGAGYLAHGHTPSSGTG